MTLEKLNLIGKGEAQVQNAHSGKIDEIVNYINDNPVPKVNYKIYRALLNQTGEDAPTAIIIENTLDGVVSYSRTDSGVYTIILPENYALNKVFVLLNAPIYPTVQFTLDTTDVINGNIALGSNFINLLGGTISGQDESFINTAIEITIYN